MTHTHNMVNVQLYYGDPQWWLENTDGLLLDDWMKTGVRSLVLKENPIWSLDFRISDIDTIGASASRWVPRPIFRLEPGSFPVTRR